MMIQSAAASDPSARAGSLDSARRPPGAAAGDDSSGGGANAASPDVVVTLGQGAPAAATYNASGRFAAQPTLDDMGANAPDSLAKATESTGDDANADAPDAGVKADQDAAVPA
jgi:hypothetical protein